MKSIIKISTLILAGLLFFASCNKDKYKVGAATVSGAVTYKNGGSGSTDPAPYASVHIAFNSLVAKTPYDMTVTADSTGKFKVDLPTGNYYFSADFTDNHGFTYTTVQGSAVSVNNSKDGINSVAIIVQ